MTENGDPYENALAERVNGILKDEWLNLEQFHSFEQAKNRISQVIKIYNEMRPHLSCGMKTPDQRHNQNSKKVKQ
jgi:transposase InsO family protein